VITPQAKILLVLMVGLLAVVLEHVASLAVLTTLTVAAVASSGVDRTWLRRGIAIMVAIVWSTVFSQALFYGQEPRTPWLAMGPVVFWVEGIEHGLVQSLRLIAVSLAGVSLALSTSPDRLLVALQRLGVPPGVCFLAVTALRFIPTLGREIMDVRTARRSRGRPAWKRSPWAWIRLEVNLLRPTIARTLRRARALSESLDARGYNPHQPRLGCAVEKWSVRDTVVVSLCSMVTLSVVTARCIYLLYTLDLVYHPGLHFVYGLVREWI